MENSIRVIIADDSPYTCVRLERHLSAFDDIDVVGVARDGVEVKTMMKQLLPDLLVMDVVMPKLDGIGVLEEMSVLRLERVPRVILMSEMRSSIWEEKAKALGADCCLEKPVQGDALSQCIQRLMKAETTRVRPRRAAKGSDKDRFIVRMLEEIGVSPGTKGYLYLREAIGMVTFNIDLLSAVTKELYPAIASVHNSTSSRVERAIRHAIESTWNRGDINAIDRFFGYTIRVEAGKPTNAECIAMLAENVRRYAAG